MNLLLTRLTVKVSGAKETKTFLEKVFVYLMLYGAEVKLS